MKKIICKEFLNDCFLCLDGTVPCRLLTWLDKNNYKEHKILLVEEKEDLYSDEPFNCIELTDNIYEFIKSTEDEFKEYSPFYTFIDYTIEETNEEELVPDDFDDNETLEARMNLKFISDIEFVDRMTNGYAETSEIINSSFYKNIASAYKKWVEIRNRK